MAKKKSNSKNSYNWQTTSSIATVISSIAAIVAICIGIKQFNKSIERTDKQIELIKKETELKIEGDRPILTINKNFVGGLKNFKQFKVSIENVGNRPAYEIELRSSILSIDKKLPNPIIIEDTVYTFTNPINRNQEIDFFGNILLNNSPHYFIKLQVYYLDEFSSKQKRYTQSFYFKWTDIQDKNYSTDMLYGIGKEEKVIVDKIFSSRN